MKIPILATGFSGLVGSRVSELLADGFEFTDLSLATGVDITNIDDVEKSINNSEARTIIHMAAKTDVDTCEDDKLLRDEGQAWMVNVVGTENIVAVAKKTGKRVIYISTDFVFDGTKEFYTEEDQPNPVNWYGITKHEGEKTVSKYSNDATVVRIAYPYRAYYPQKKDFVRRILERCKRGEKLIGITDHIITPAFIDDIAYVLKTIIEKKLSGIFHAVGSQSMSVFDAIKLVEKIFGFSGEVEPVTREIYFQNKALRPFKLVLKNDKINKLGIKMSRFDEGLEEIKKQQINLSL